jgi:hypothetical protein
MKSSWPSCTNWFNLFYKTSYINGEVNCTDPSYAKLKGRLGDGQPLHVSETPGQLAPERSFNI